MLKKNLKILIITIILSVIALVLILQQSKSTIKLELRNFAVEDTTNITKVFIVDKANQSVILKKIKPGLWTLNDTLLAHREVVNTLLQTLLKIAVREPVAKAAHNNIIKQLATASNKVEVYEKQYLINFLGIKLFPRERLIKTFYVGHDTQDNQGTYMLLENSSVAFITYIPGFRGFLSTRFSTKEKDWRDPTIFSATINEIKEVEVRYPADNVKSYVIKEISPRNYELVALKNNKPVQKYDTLAVLDFLSCFRKLSYESLLDHWKKSSIDSMLRTTPYFIITLTKKNNNKTTIKTYRKKAEPTDLDLDGKPLVWDPYRLYVIFNNDREVATITYYGYDRIFLTIDEFIPKN